MQLTHNRHFKHKFHKRGIIKTVVRKSDNSSNPGHHLYIECDEDAEIIGMSGQKSFMLCTSLQHDKWEENLLAWAKINMYEAFTPQENRLSVSEALDMLKQARSQTKPSNHCLLGQALINLLGDKTPTPNSEIFNTLNENKVLAWFYDQHVITENKG